MARLVARYVGITGLGVLALIFLFIKHVSCDLSLT
jgi:hypothetical protein